MQVEVTSLTACLKVSKETPTESTYSAAMTCCRGAEQWETALHLNEEAGLCEGHIPTMDLNGIS